MTPHLKDAFHGLLSTQQNTNLQEIMRITIIFGKQAQTSAYTAAD